jgi:hypothetical protein
LGPKSGRGVLLTRKRKWTVRHHLDAVEEVFGGDGNTPAFEDVGRHLAGDRQVQIGGDDAQKGGTVYRQKDVCEDGHRTFSLGDTLHARQEPNKVLFGEGEFHAGAPDDWRLRWSLVAGGGRKCVFWFPLEEICSGVDRACEDVEQVILCCKSDRMKVDALRIGRGVEGP